MQFDCSNFPPSFLSTCVPQGGLTAVLHLLDWAWSKLTQPPPPQSDSSSPSPFIHDPHHLAFISKAALGLLKTYVQEAFPEKGRIRQATLDCPEIAEAVFQARTLLRLILASRGGFVPMDKQGPMALVLDACCDTFRACFHAFYPSVPLKWFALCQQLQFLDPVIKLGKPTALCGGRNRSRTLTAIKLKFFLISVIRAQGLLVPIYSHCMATRSTFKEKPTALIGCFFSNPPFLPTPSMMS